MGTFYKPSPRPDELYHWKYKDKYRKGDHWVYIYDDGSTSEASPKTTTTESASYYNPRTHEHHYNEYERTVSTNPKKLFSSRTELNSHSTINVNGKDHHIDYTHETIEYGRLHMHKMNVERRLSDVKEKAQRKIKRGKKKNTSLA